VNSLLINSWNKFLCKCINHHTGWGQSLLILIVRAWNEKKSSLLFLSHSKISIFLAVPFWAWIIILSWKISTRITPHTGRQVKILMKKDRWKAIRKPKKKGAQKTQMLGGVPKSQEKVIAKIKWVCPGQNNEKGQTKEEWQKKRWKTQRLKLLIVIFSLWNLETLFESYESFSFIAKNHRLHYVLVEEYFFIRVMTLRTSYSLLFILIKWVFKKR
jgi:hypothetical protein